jgi:hypothetical protein
MASVLFQLMSKPFDLTFEHVQAFSAGFLFSEHIIQEAPGFVVGILRMKDICLAKVHKMAIIGDTRRIQFLQDVCAQAKDTWVRLTCRVSSLLVKHHFRFSVVRMSRPRWLRFPLSAAVTTLPLAWRANSLYPFPRHALGMPFLIALVAYCDKTLLPVFAMRIGFSSAAFTNGLQNCGTDFSRKSAFPFLP